MVTAPMLAAGPETVLVGIWARRAEEAAKLAARHASRAFADYEELLDACDAVAFSVAPDAQPPLAARAARAGKALLLEKPIAADLDAARALAEATDGVPTLVMLSNRYLPHVRTVLAQAAAFETAAARGMFVSGAFLPGSPFAFGWRLDRGPLLDVGPHIIDLAWAAVGDVGSVHATGSLNSVVTLELEHGSGARTQLVVSASVPLERQRVELDLFGPAGCLSLDAMAGDFPALLSVVRREFAHAAATGERHPLDVRRGLRLQELIAQAEFQLA
jgi:predicted dehydrogenase